MKNEGKDLLSIDEGLLDRKTHHAVTIDAFEPALSRVEPAQVNTASPM